MPYRVRSEGGEVKFQSLYEIQRAIATGLVAPEDELTEEGEEKWRKVNSEVSLRDAKPDTTRAKGDLGRWVIPLCVLLFVCLALCYSEKYRIAGLALAVFLTLLLSQFTFKVLTKRRVR